MGINCMHRFAILKSHDTWDMSTTNEPRQPSHWYETCLSNSLTPLPSSHHACSLRACYLFPPSQFVFTTSMAWEQLTPALFGPLPTAACFARASSHALEIHVGRSPNIDQGFPTDPPHFPSGPCSARPTPWQWLSSNAHSTFWYRSLDCCTATFWERVPGGVPSLARYCAGRDHRMPGSTALYPSSSRWTKVSNECTFHLTSIV